MVVLGRSPVRLAMAERVELAAFAGAPLGSDAGPRRKASLDLCWPSRPRRRCAAEACRGRTPQPGVRRGFDLPKLWPRSDPRRWSRPRPAPQASPPCGARGGGRTSVPLALPTTIRPCRPGSGPGRPGTRASRGQGRGRSPATRGAPRMPRKWWSAFRRRDDPSRSRPRTEPRPNDASHAMSRVSNGPLRTRRPGRR